MTVDNFSTIKADVITLGGFTDSQLLTLQIQMLIDEILAYCYREDVPSDMELPISDVIVNELNKRSLIVGEGNITSYKEGDMSINFGNEVAINGTNLKYGGKLEKFKKIIGAL